MVWCMMGPCIKDGCVGEGKRPAPLVVEGVRVCTSCAAALYLERRIEAAIRAGAVCMRAGGHHTALPLTHSTPLPSPHSPHFTLITPPDNLPRGDTVKRAMT